MIGGREIELNYFKGKVFSIDNIISESECDFLVDTYIENGPTHKWIDFFPMSVDPKVNKTSFFIFKKIEKAINCHLKYKIEIDWCEIVCRPTKSGHPQHFDSSSNKTIFTSITYLNDNYDGGETYLVDDMIIFPKKGRTIFFDGCHYLHGVSSVKSGNRYTVPIWYKKKESNFKFWKWKK